MGSETREAGNYVKQSGWRLQRGAITRSRVSYLGACGRMKMWKYTGLRTKQMLAADCWANALLGSHRWRIDRNRRYSRDDFKKGNLVEVFRMTEHPYFFIFFSSAWMLSTRSMCVCACVHCSELRGTIVALVAT